MSDQEPVWRSLGATPCWTSESLREQLDGGQAFRWHLQPDDTWLGYWGNRIAQLKWSKTSNLHWQPTSPIDDAFELELRAYLALDSTETCGLSDDLPWLTDAHLRRCMEAFPSLRILRQPFGETLLGFLCSATKQIVQIKQMMALLAKRHGTPYAHTSLPNPSISQVLPKSHCHITYDNDSNTPEYKFFMLPTWGQLAEVSETELRACQLGFRARYIKGTADYIAEHPGWLEHTATLPYAEAKEALCTLPGVGEKIADCVALFGLGHQQAFPVDTWMIKAMQRRYGLEGWTPSQVAHFGRVHFGAHAGLAQQYLFAWERAHGGR